MQLRHGREGARPSNIRPLQNEYLPRTLHLIRHTLTIDHGYGEAGVAPTFDRIVVPIGREPTIAAGRIEGSAGSEDIEAISTLSRAAG